MRYLMTYVGKDKHPSPEKLAAIGKFGEEATRAGILLDTGGILPISLGGAGKLENGKFTLIDGPFPETKEMVVGYAIVQVRSREEAIEQARRFMMVAGDGECEIRQLVGPADGATYE
jgi:hypothetical protein